MVPIDTRHFFGERPLPNHRADKVECEWAWIVPEPRHHTAEQDITGSRREEEMFLGAKYVRLFPSGFDYGSDVAHPRSAGCGDGQKILGQKGAEMIWERGSEIFWVKLLGINPSVLV